MGGLKLVIFDVDGTLVDSQNSIVMSMTDAFAALGRPTPDRGELLSIVGLSLPVAFGRLAPWASDAENAALVEAYKSSYVRNRAGGADGSALYPGARAALDLLAGQDETLLGVATGKSRRGFDILVENHGLAGLFQTVQVADDHPSKPHPSMILTALAETGVEADDAVVVGDTSFDIEMAAGAGVRGIGVTWGYHPAAALRSAGAARLIDGFEDLPRALGALWG